MTHLEILERLRAVNVLSPPEVERLAAYEQARRFSLHAELRTALYVGVLLLSGGLGVLIYQNLDTIGHQVITAGITALMAGCFWYVWRERKPYANGFVRHASPLPDYALLLGCLLFLSLETFVQVQYQFFGTRYGLATILPAVFFLALAYRFDHRGVLAMGLTALASWVGLAAAPLEVLSENAFSAPSVRHTALVFGVAVTGAALLLERWTIKAHFTPTFLILAGNLSAVAALVGWFGEAPAAYAYLPLVLGWCAVFLWYARRTHSFFFLLLAVGYAYVAVTYLFFRILPEDLALAFALYYFVLSCGGIVWFLFQYKRLLGIPTPQ
jgi:hypothetical protein